MKIEIDPRFPNDDGKKQRAWVKGAEIRGDTASERVLRVLEERSFLDGKIEVTEKNSQEDMVGYDMFIPMRESLLNILSIRSKRKGVPVQVKSSDHAVRQFLNTHGIYKQERLIFRNGDYIFTFNGQYASDLIVADMVGQMLVLASGKMDEPAFLTYLAEVEEDKAAVERWIENREIILDSWWYRELLVR